MVDSKERVFAINVHMSSKGGSSSLHGDARPPVNGVVEKRIAQIGVLAVRQFLRKDPSSLSWFLSRTLSARSSAWTQMLRLLLLAISTISQKQQQSSIHSPQNWWTLTKLQGFPLLNVIPMYSTWTRSNLIMRLSVLNFNQELRLNICTWTIGWASRRGHLIMILLYPVSSSVKKHHHRCLPREHVQVFDNLVRMYILSPSRILSMRRIPDSFVH